MPTPTYREQLLHPNWQRKRLEILNRDNFKCQVCGDSESTLHVHHRRYFKGRMAWDYDGDELVSLCECCHEVVHSDDNALKELLAQLPFDGPASSCEAYALIAGFANGLKVGDFSGAFQGSPSLFTIGEIAAMLYKLDLRELFDLCETLRSNKDA